MILKIINNLIIKTLSPFTNVPKIFYSLRDNKKSMNYTIIVKKYLILKP